MKTHDHNPDKAFRRGKTVWWPASCGAGIAKKPEYLRPSRRVDCLRCLDRRERVGKPFAAHRKAER